MKQKVHNLFITLLLGFKANALAKQLCYVQTKIYIIVIFLYNLYIFVCTQTKMYRLYRKIIKWSFFYRIYTFLFRYNTWCLNCHIQKCLIMNNLIKCFRCTFKAYMNSKGLDQTAFVQYDLGLHWLLTESMDTVKCTNRRQR